MSEIKLNTPLTVSEIDFRIQSINNGGYATILVYKDARVDMERLDAVHGELWQREHHVINGNLFCRVGVYNKEINDWVWREDVGTESMAEKEKGQASDAFKRACFNLGIGRELYSYPLISIKLNGNGTDKSGEWEKLEGSRANKQTWNLKLKEWTWYSEFDGNTITFLAAKDQGGNLRFKWGEMKPTFITEEWHEKILVAIDNLCVDDIDGRSDKYKATMAELGSATGYAEQDISNGSIKASDLNKFTGFLNLIQGE